MFHKKHMIFFVPEHYLSAYELQNYQQALHKN